jgi:hypothetical protein
MQAELFEENYRNADESWKPAGLKLILNKKGFLTEIGEAALSFRNEDYSSCYFYNSFFI